MLVSKAYFDEYNGNKVYSYTLDNGNGLVAEILNFGGIIRRLWYKGRDVVLGYDNIDDYVNGIFYFGAIIGRNSNRIENAEFELNGETYKLFKNERNSNLHGGKIGFSHKIWDVSIPDPQKAELVLLLRSEDGDEGFPGNADIKVTYTLTSDNAIKIHYEGISDKDTVLNMTNHSYFNLNGHGTGNIKKHTLWLDSDFYTPNNDQCLPTGEILSVIDTPFDFLTETSLESRIESPLEQIRMFNGFDHNFVLNGRGYRKIAKLCGDKSGIAMEVYTDTPGAQVYVAGDLDLNNCKDGCSYGNHDGICIETQFFPNALKFSHFPDVILKKGEKYDSTTSFKFI